MSLYTLTDVRYLITVMRLQKLSETIAKTQNRLIAF